MVYMVCVYVLCIFIYIVLKLKWGFGACRRVSTFIFAPF